MICLFFWPYLESLVAMAALNEATDSDVKQGVNESVESGKSHRTHPLAHNPGYPSRSFPSFRRPLFPVPRLPRWEPLPLFWTNFTSPDLGPLCTPPSLLPPLSFNMDDNTVKITRQKAAHCVSPPPGRNLRQQSGPSVDLLDLFGKEFDFVRFPNRGFYFIFQQRQTAGRGHLG